MDAQDIGIVSVSVVGLTQLVKWSGLKDGLGPLVVLALSALGVGLWAYSEGTYERTKLFAYFASWIIVATSAAGVFGFTRASSTAVTAATSPPAGGAGSSTTFKN